MYRRIPRPHPDVPNQRSTAGLVYANIVMYASSCVQEGPIGPARGRSVAHYGLVIDQPTWVGCHACTVACKMENDVPPPPCRIQGRGARFRETSPEAAGIGPRGAAGRGELRKTNPCPRKLCGPLPGAPTPAKSGDKAGPTRRNVHNARAGTIRIH